MQTMLPNGALYCEDVWYVHSMSFQRRQTLPELYILLLSLPRIPPGAYTCMCVCCMQTQQTIPPLPWPSGPQQTTLYGQVAHCNMSQGTRPPQPLLNFGPMAHNKLLYMAKWPTTTCHRAQGPHNHY